MLKKKKKRTIRSDIWSFTFCFLIASHRNTSMALHADSPNQKWKWQGGAFPLHLQRHHPVQTANWRWVHKRWETLCYCTNNFHLIVFCISLYFWDFHIESFGVIAKGPAITIKDKECYRFWLHMSGFDL